MVTFYYICTKQLIVRIIAKRTLRDFWIKHADSEQQLKSWYRETEKANWKNINELKSEYPNASILKNNRIVFNIKGNNYRLIVKFNFDYEICWIRFMGTHAEYDKIDANEI
nr:type II toxin-antitoxin system HigB family toxin [Aquimarina sp. U1-2]